jgi:tetraacyldisaccharide 4'-kinase
MSSFTKGVMTGVSQMYAAVAAGKNLLYDSGFLDHCKLKTPVLSVGNLTMGGTGKTPLCLWIADEVLKKGKRPCIVARGYGASISHPRLVDATVESAVAQFGDEAVQMKLASPEVTVVVGNPKWQAALWAEQQFKPDLIILDDGFQHRTLFRNFDLVLIDVSQPVQSIQPLPLGQGRESVEGLKRADLVVLSKINSCSAEQLEQYKAVLGELNSRQVEYHSTVENLPPEYAFILASGIGNFQVLRSELVRLLGESKIKETFEFRDHHHFTHHDAQKLLNALVSRQAQKILITQKDAVKLSAFPELKEYLSVVQLQIRWRELPKEIYEFFDTHLL